MSTKQADFGLLHSAIGCFHQAWRAFYQKLPFLLWMVALPLYTAWLGQLLMLRGELITGFLVVILSLCWLIWSTAAVHLAFTRLEQIKDPASAYYTSFSRLPGYLLILVGLGSISAAITHLSTVLGIIFSILSIICMFVYFVEGKGLLATFWLSFLTLRNYASQILIYYFLVFSTLVLGVILSGVALLLFIRVLSLSAELAAIVFTSLVLAGVAAAYILGVSSITSFHELLRESNIKDY